MGKRRHNRRRSRRNAKRGRKNHRSTSSLLRMATSSLRGINTTRSMTFIPKQVSSSSNQPKDSWLEQALPYLTVVMRLFGALLKTERLSESKVYISSTVQSILIGAEDILFDHPITKVEQYTIQGKETDVMTIDYAMARVHTVEIVISMMGPFSNRAGRIAAYLKPISRERAEHYWHADSGDMEYTGEVKTFQQLTQMPGCVISPNLRPMKLSVKPSGFSSMPVEIGEAGRPLERAIIGGLPLFQLIVGYQDLASDTNDPKTMYSISEAALCVEISGSVSLDQPVSSPRLLRSKPITVFAANAITVREGMGKFQSIPTKYVSRGPEGLTVDMLKHQNDLLSSSLTNLEM